MSVLTSPPSQGSHPQHGRAGWRVRNRHAVAVGLTAIIVLAAAPLYALDLGVQGQTWDIIEIDIRGLLMASAARADWAHVTAQIRGSAQHYLDNLPKREASTVSQTRTRWLDPSFSLDQDIRAPVQNARGDWEWQVLYKKGSRFNPLSVQQPHNAMFFFDGAVKAQVAFAAQLIARYPAKLMLVEATGMNPEPIARDLHAPIYTASESMVTRFRIQATPALLFPGEGSQALMLGLTELAAPYSMSQIEQAWSALRTSPSGGSH
jgi:conjugal transfer pilus assembly protein TraW